MKFSEANEYMMRVVGERAERFSGLDLTVKIERDLMDRMFSPTDKERSARFITVSLVISAVDGAKEDEYALSLGAEVKHGEVDEGELSKSLAELDAAIDETVTRLSAAEYIPTEISRMCRESEEEYDLFLAEVKKSSRRAMIRSAVFSGIIIILMLAFSLIAKYAAG